MIKKSIAILVMALLMAFTLGAQTISIEYIDGYLDIMDGGSWVEAYIGDTLTTSDTIRLDEDSYVDLKSRGTNLSLTSPGTYKVSELLQANSESSNLGVSSMVSGKLAVLLNGPSHKTQSTVGGVRAAEAEAGPKLDWMGSDTAELIKDGKTAIEESRFDSALEFFEEAYDLALDEQEETETLFYMGWTKYMKGETSDALENLMDLPPDTYSDTYHSHYLITGNILVTTFAFEAALEWFADYDAQDAAFENSEAEQMIYLLMGISSKQVGNNNDAKKWLQDAVMIDNASDTAEAARTLLTDL